MARQGTNDKNIRAAIIFWFLTAAYMAVIFYLSSHRMVNLPRLPENFDKIVHIGIYIPLSFLLYTSLRRSGISRHIFILSVIFSGIYGITDEFHQSFVPGRDSSHWDVVADITGAFIGSAGARFLRL